MSTKVLRPTLVDETGQRYIPGYTSSSLQVFLVFPDETFLLVDRGALAGLDISTQTDDFVAVFAVPKGDGHERVAVPLGQLVEFARNLFPVLRR